MEAERTLTANQNEKVVALGQKLDKKQNRDQLEFPKIKAFKVCAISQGEAIGRESYQHVRHTR